MMPRLLRRAALTALVVGLALWSSPWSKADFQMTITATNLSTSAVTSATIFDNGTGDGTPLTPGNITFNNTLGQFADFSTTSNITALSELVANGALMSETFLAFENKSATDKYQVEVQVTIGTTVPLGYTGASGYTFPGAALIQAESVINTGNSSGANAGNLVSLKTYADASGAEYGTGTFLGTQSATTVTGLSQPIPLGPATLGPVNILGNKASMYQDWVFVINPDAAYNLGATETLTPVPVPEPSTFAIAGLGALGLIGFGLRRRRA